MTTIKQDLENSIFTKTRKEDIITVTLADGQIATYTKGIMPLMVGDPMVKRIVAYDGEIIYEA